MTLYILVFQIKGNMRLDYSNFNNYLNNVVGYNNWHNKKMKEYNKNTFFCGALGLCDFQKWQLNILRREINSLKMSNTHGRMA